MRSVDLIFNRLPADYRWANEFETEFFSILPDAIQVRRGGTDNEPWTDIAVPAALPEWRNA